MTYWNSKGHYAIATPKIVATFKRKRKKKYLLQPIIK